MSESSRGRGTTKKVAAPRGRGRRSQAERGELSQAERDRNKAREAEFQRERAAQAAAERRQQLERRARDGQRGRGRGGFMGERKPAPTASGPFSAGSVFQPAAKVGKAFPRPWAPSKRDSRAGPSSSKVKKEDEDLWGAPATQDFSDIIGNGIDKKPEDGGWISSDPEEAGEGERKDVDFINLLSDEEGDAAGAAERFDSPALFPVRIQRVEHKNRAPPINPEASSTVVKTQPQDSDGDMELDAVPKKSSRNSKQRAGEDHTSRRWQGVYEDDSDVVVEEAATHDHPQSPPTSPKASRSPEKQKRKLRSPAEEQVFQTEEDKEEHARRQKQIDVLLDELGGVSLTDEAREGASAPDGDQKADRVYIFQFPSKLPNLVSAAAAVKDEPSPPPTLGSEPPSVTAPPAQMQPHGPRKPIKVEDDGPAATPAPGAPTLTLPQPSHRPVIAPGYLGKLRIHRSGKATLDYGGNSMIVSKGLDESILEDVVVVRPKKNPEGYGQQNGEAASGGPSGGATSGASRHPAGEPVTEQFGGEALAFGQVRGKFVVTPDWDELWG